MLAMIITEAGEEKEKRPFPFGQQSHIDVALEQPAAMAPTEWQRPACRRNADTQKEKPG